MSGRGLPRRPLNPTGKKTYLSLKQKKCIVAFMKKNPKENCKLIPIADIIEVDPIRPRVLKQTSITNFFKR